MGILGAALSPETESAMFLRDGWPNAVVCKVLMKDGCVGIGIWRYPGNGAQRPTPEQADQFAMLDAMGHISSEPPDYTELHEHVAKMAAMAKNQSEMAKAARQAARQAAEEPDHDLQASLGQKAHD